MEDKKTKNNNIKTTNKLFLQTNMVWSFQYNKQQAYCIFFSTWNKIKAQHTRF